MVVGEPIKTVIPVNPNVTRRHRIVRLNGNAAPLHYRWCRATVVAINSNISVNLRATVVAANHRTACDTIIVVYHDQFAI
jgi:hypothetical protein